MPAAIPRATSQTPGRTDAVVARRLFAAVTGSGRHRPTACWNATIKLAADLHAGRRRR